MSSIRCIRMRNGSGIGVFALAIWSAPRLLYFGIKKKICADPNASSNYHNIAPMTGETIRAASSGRPLTLAVSDHYNWTATTWAQRGGCSFGVNTVTASGGGGSASGQRTGLPRRCAGRSELSDRAGCLGFEADYDASTQNKSLPAGVLTGSTSQTPWLATLRGRFGIAFDRYLVYATAGGAPGELRSIANVPAGTTNTTVTYGTWTAGAGLEYGITDNLSARIEYLYFDQSNIATGVVGPPTTQISSQFQNNLMRAGLNYRFPAVW